VTESHFADWKPETLAVHAGEQRPQLGGSVVQPIFQSATWLTEDGEAEPRYLRLSNSPNHLSTAAKIAALEGVDAGLVTASGMAAMTTSLLSVLKSGDHLIAQDCLYGGTRAFLAERAPALGIDVSFVSLEDPSAWQASLRPETRAFVVEAISNPLLQVGRLDEAADFARGHGLVSIIDSTFATPIAFRPAELGYELIVHSATKFLGGHSDLVAGVVCGPTARVEACRHTLTLLGGCLDPNSCFLLSRGLKTLPLRVRAASETALMLARELDDHPAVDHVDHPGLRHHPGHERATRWFSGFGAMLSFVPHGGLEAAERLLPRLRVATVAPSLGGVETLVSRPAVTSHLSVPKRERETLGIPDEMIRVSVGVEHPDDLLADFRHALG